MKNRAQRLASQGLIELNPTETLRMAWQFDKDCSISIDMIAQILKKDLDPDYREDWQEMLDKLLPTQNIIDAVIYDEIS